MTELDRELLSIIHESKDPAKVREYMMGLILDYLKANTESGRQTG